MPRSYRNSEKPLPIMRGSPVPKKWRVPPHDWDGPPWNRWSFQNIRALVPTGVVSCGSDVWALEGSGAEHDNLRFDAADGRSTTWGQLLDDSYTDGTMIWHDGKVLVEQYFNAMTPATPHIAFSVSKSVISAVTGMLIEDGLMDPDAPFTTYLPELEKTAWKGASLQHVLDMTSGVHFDETYGDHDAEVFLLDVAAGLKPLYPWMDADKVPETVWELILSLRKRAADHGSRFDYRSIETDALGYAMERVTGQRLPELISERLWQPMGAERDGFFTVDRAGFALADGGFCACLGDMLRFGRLLLEDGRREGRRIVPKAWIDDIRHGDHGLFDDHGREFLPEGRYRNQFWIMDKARPAHLSLGIFGQHIFVDPEAGIVAAKFSSWPDFLSDEDWVMDWVAGVRAVVAEHGG